MITPTEQQQKLLDSIGYNRDVVYWIGRGQHHNCNNMLFYLIQQMLNDYKEKDANTNSNETN